MPAPNPPSMLVSTAPKTKNMHPEQEMYMLSKILTCNQPHTMLLPHQSNALVQEVHPVSLFWGHEEKAQHW
jgi:hypothetical protein